MLGIDTAGRSGSVALVDETQILASFYLRHSPPFSSHLMRLVDAVFAQVGYRINDLGGVAVSLGPGGFTSLRVGLATAQGLAMATGKPLVGCSTFEALVAMAAGWQGIVCPMLEARRGEVYAAFYYRQEATVCEVMPGMVTTPDTLCTFVTERTLFLGSGVRVYRAFLASTLGTHAVCLENVVEGELAASVAHLGQARLHNAGTIARHTLTPLYVRAADARLPRYPVTGVAPSLPLSTTESGG